MRLPDEVYEDIKQQSISMLIEMGINSVPIDPFELSNKLGLRVIPYSAFSGDIVFVLSLKEPDGFSIEDGKGGWAIYYNDSVKYERVRFTIMHEIGHYILGHYKGGEVEESEANFFARYTLAAPPLIHNILSAPNPETISKEFEISYTAATHAHSGYWAWIDCGDEYMDYEIDLLKQFKIK